MENKCRFGYGKFFRGLIAVRQPEEIIKLVEKYKASLEAQESNYFDIVIRSDGLVSYEELLRMPVDSIALFVSRLNNYREEMDTARKQKMGRM